MEVPIIEIFRHWQDKNQTVGTCTVIGTDGTPLFACLSLERGWRNNEKNVSCVPADVYELRLEHSNRFGKDLWELKNVVDRSECKFHSANYWHQLNGCIALGLEAKYLDSDGYIDITHSGDTMKLFHNALKDFDRAILRIKTQKLLIN